jgi:D-hexose-6-phosphate mutarotase
LELRDDAATHAHWPSCFQARLHVALTPSCIEVGLEIRNLDDASIAFTAALHTYLRVDDLMDASLHGLEAAPYLDSARGQARMAGDGRRGALRHRDRPHLPRCRCAADTARRQRRRGRSPRTISATPSSGTPAPNLPLQPRTWALASTGISSAWSREW